jgi:hypothetical protein
MTNKNVNDLPIFQRSPFAKRPDFGLPPQNPGNVLNSHDQFQICGFFIAFYFFRFAKTLEYIGYAFDFF